MRTAPATPSQEGRTRGQTIAENSFWSAVDQLASYIAGFLAIVAVARALGPSKLGEYSYIFFLCSMASLVGALGVPVATRKYLAELLGRGDRRFCRSIIRTSFRFQLAMATLIVSAGLALVVTTASPENRTFALIAVVSVFPQMMLAIPTSVNVALEDFAANVVPSLVSEVVHLAGVAAALLLGWDLIGLAGALLASRTVDLLVRYALYRRRLARIVDPTGQDLPLPSELRDRIRRFCFQSSVLQLLTLVVWDRSELLFLKHFCDIREVAFYSAGFGFTRQLMLAPQVFTSAAGASLMVRVGQDPHAARRMAAVALRYVALLSLPLTVGLAVLSGPAIRLTYGNQYLPAIPVLTVVALFGSARALLLPAQQLLVALDRQDVLVRWTLVMAVLNVSLDLLLIPRAGALGGAVANSAVQTVTMVGLWTFTVRRLQTPFPAAQIGRLVVSTAGMAAAAAAAGQLASPLFAAVIGVPLGASVFLVLLRWTHWLDASDRDRLTSLEGQLPVRLRRLYRWTLNAIALPLT